MQFMFLPRFLSCTFCFAILVFSTSAFAQKQFGSAQGTVRDAEGQPIPGASLVASSELWGSTDANTDKSGRYRIDSLIPGTYKLEARLAGFESVLKGNVRISVGSVSVIDFVLEPEKVTESVTVQGETPLIDSTTTAIAYTIPPEIIQGLPARQDFRSLLALTPGVGDDGVAYGGSPDTSSRIWIDGVDISNAANGGIFLSTRYPYNWFEEVQVVGNGAPAEYGNYLGVIGNFVTRSGGNQFHGLLETFFENQNLVSTNAPNAGPESPFKSWDLGAQIGGPIIRDKLWFFSGLQYSSTQTTPFGYDGVTTENSPNFITKLTYKPNQKNTIQGFAKFSGYRIDGGGADFGTLPEATRVETCDESSWNGTWISLLTTATTLEGRLGGYWAKCDFLPRSADVAAHINSDTDVLSGNAPYTRRIRRFRSQGNFALTHYAQNFLGNHEFKFGVQFQNSSARQENSINGGFIYNSYINYGTTYNWRFSYLQNPMEFDGDIDQINLYVQDTWQLNDHFALSLGLRWDHNRGSTDRGVVSSSDPVAPRIGAIWSIRENKPIVIKAHYGDYYDALLTRQFSFLSDQQFGFQWDYFDNTTHQWLNDTREQIVYLSAPDNKHPFVRQFTVGMDQELPLGIAAGAHYIYRKWHNILGNIEMNPDYQPVAFRNPVTGEMITVYSRPPSSERYSLLTNPEGLYRRYDGFEVYLNRRFLNQLALSASFVYSKTQGNTPDLPERYNSSYNEILNDPNSLINFSGHLVNDPAFAWKFSGIYDFPYGLNLGFFFRHQSGDTWAPLVDLRDTVNPPGVVIFGLPRGSYRLPSQNILDLRIEKQLAMLGGQFRLTVDIFNVMNAAYVTSVNPHWGNDSYGQPTTFVDPREILLGLRYTF
jgi:outer membrane receptor protein involved in Fe transport